MSQSIEDKVIVDAANSVCELIEAQSDAVDATLCMTQPIIDALANEGLFHLMVPKLLRGTEANVSTIISVCESIAYADGSVGWSFAQNTNVLGYTAYLSPSNAATVAAAQAAAGVFAPLGVAHKEENGFRVSGHYPFASGCSHADFIGSGALEMHNGEMPPFDEKGLPRIRCFFVRKSQAQIDSEWDVMGLRGTGSFDYHIAEQFVDKGMTFSLFETVPVTGGSLYGLGPIPLSALGSSAWAIGVASRALDEILQIAESGRARLGSPALKDQQVFQRQFGEHSAALHAARLLLHDRYNEAVEYIAQGNECTTEFIANTRAAATFVVMTAKAATSFAFQAAGSQSLRNPSKLQRCFRDLFTGGSHVVFDEGSFEDFTKTKLGIKGAASEGGF